MKEKFYLYQSELDYMEQVSEYLIEFHTNDGRKINIKGKFTITEELKED